MTSNLYFIYLIDILWHQKYICDNIIYVKLVLVYFSCIYQIATDIYIISYICLRYIMGMYLRYCNKHLMALESHDKYIFHSVTCMQIYFWYISNVFRDIYNIIYMFQISCGYWMTSEIYFRYCNMYENIILIYQMSSGIYMVSYICFKYHLDLEWLLKYFFHTVTCMKI